MPTHLTDSQLARFRTNPLEPFDKVNIGIKSILASHVIQWRTWRMLLTVTTSVVEYSCLHSADNKEHDYYNSGTSGSQPAAPPDDSIHATFAAVRLKWSKDCIIQLRLILQRLIKCCTRLPAEFDGDFGNSNHHFVQFHQNWEMLRCCPCNILVELHKTLIPKKCFV